MRATVTETTSVIDGAKKRGRKPMQRRKFVVGLGSLAAGSGAAMGTGAFDAVQADRTIKIDVSGDAGAFLRLEANDTPNGNEYVEDDGTGGTTLSLDFTETDEGGTGLNQNARTIIRDLFTIENQGTQKVYIGVTNLPEGMSIYADDDSGSVPGSAGVTLNQDTQGKGSNNLPQIGPGGSLQRVGVIFRVDDEIGDGGPADALKNFHGTITINAYTEDEV
jgi:hypothetical protein